MKSKIITIVFIWIAGFIIAVDLGCDSKDVYIGSYQAVDAAGLPERDIRIELMKNGKGVWKRGDEEVNFSWYIKKDMIRINTKDGGIMSGNIKRKGITMIMPGDIEITFKKIS